MTDDTVTPAQAEAIARRRLAVHRSLLDALTPPVGVSPGSYLTEGDIVTVHRPDGTVTTVQLGPVYRTAPDHAQIATFTVPEP